MGPKWTRKSVGGWVLIRQGVPFADLAEVEERLRLYEELCNRQPQPFAWEFTTDKLHDFLRRLAAKSGQEPGTYL